MAQRISIFILCLACLGGPAGCGSDDAGPTTPVPAAAGPDLAPPAVPVDLAASGALGYVKLAWRANTTDSDLAGYRVYRDAFGVTALLTEVDAQTNRWVDHEPQVGTYRYAVTAVDETGNESAWTTVPYTTELSLPDVEQAP